MSHGSGGILLNIQQGGTTAHFYGGGVATLNFSTGTTATFNAGTGAVDITASGGAGSGTVTNTGTLTSGKAIIGNGTVDVKASKLTLTDPATTATLTIADNKVFTVSNTLTFTGTDTSSVAFGAGGTVVYTGAATGSGLTMATARLLGRTTALSGAIEEISVGTGLSLSAGSLTNTVTAPTGANPTASVGLAAVNGSAATFLRSDGAPALDVTIAPTWSGAHVWSLANAAAVAIGPAGNTNPVLRIITNTASQADGLSINGLAAGSGVTLAALSSGTDSPITLTPKGTGSVVFPNGAVATPAIRGADADSGLYFVGNNVRVAADGVNTIEFTAGGSPAIRMLINGGIGWSASTTDPTTLDTTISRNAAGVVQISTGTVGQWGSLLVGVRDAGTTTVTNGLTVGHQSSGTPAAGLGSAILWNINSSTTADQNAGQHSVLWTDSTHATRTADHVFSNVNSAAALAETFRIKASGDAVHTVANGAALTIGSATELLTLSTVGLTTDTTANLLPANAIILAVDCRITTTITTTTNWAVGDGTTSARFSSANATLTAGTVSVGLNHMQGSVATDAAGPVQTTAAKVRITCTGSNPGAGVIRITVHYLLLGAATS